jgi:chemotaxis methyl-accepting protein methylase
MAIAIVRETPLEALLETGRQTERLPLATEALSIALSTARSRALLYIEVADRGVYPQSALDGLPPATIRNYFSKISSPTISPNGAGTDASNDVRGEANDYPSCISQTAVASAAHLLVKPRLRSLVTFNCMNLARPGYIGRFDCIFCMDVLPHFSRAQRIALIERLHLYLEPGGYLFLSQTEKLITSNLNFRAETYDGYTFHRKPPAASAAYGR